MQDRIREYDVQGQKGLQLTEPHRHVGVGTDEQVISNLAGGGKSAIGQLHHRTALCISFYPTVVSRR